MSYLNKLSQLSSAVQGAVSNVSKSVEGMMGDEIYKLYEMPKDCTASGGHECCWKIYPGISKKTQAEVSIFVFDKSSIKKQPKEVQDRILDIMRTDMKTLRLLRHPHVLKVEEVFEESKSIMSFVTEKVVCSLANACKVFDNVENVTPEIMEIGLSEFEIACGLSHVGEALSFLHREGRRVHLSLSPQSIFLTPKGEWKLGGFGFARTLEPGQSSRSEYYSCDVPRSEKVPPIRVEPPLEYCAPELITEPRKFTSSADMFSLGLIVYELFLPPGADGKRTKVLDVGDDNVMTHGYKVQSMHPINFQSCVPVSIQNTIRSLLQAAPTSRPEARMFLSSQFFESGAVKTLRTLQSLVEQDPASQAKFLQGLPDQLESFPSRILRDMVIDGLQSVSLNPQLTPFVINPLLKVVEILDKPTFGYKIAPMLAPMLAMKEPVQCMLMFATSLHILIPKADDGFIRDHVVPMLCRALDSNVPEILDTVLNKIVDQANLFEYRILKQVILPRVNKLILQPPQMSVRVNALLWLAKSYHVFDKDLLSESVLPTLQQCLEVDKSPAVCMCILGCYDSLGTHLGADFIARSILPSITPLLVERTLNSQQFDIVCQKTQALLKLVIQERDKSLMAENSVKGATASLEATAGISAAVNAVSVSKEKSSGVAAAKTMLQEGPRHESPVVGSGSTSKSSDPHTDDPFYIGGKKSEPSSGSSEVSYAERRRERKEKRKADRQKRNSKESTADILGMSSTTTTTPASPVSSTDMFQNMNIGSASQQQSSLSQGGNNNNNMFSGMSLGGATSNNTTSAMVPMNTGGMAAAMSSSGGYGQHNTQMMNPQMNQQQNAYGDMQQQYGMQNMNAMQGGGYGMQQGQQQFNNTMGGNTGPGGLLQIQNSGANMQGGGGINPYPPASQGQQGNSDPFSAFDSM